MYQLYLSLPQLLPYIECYWFIHATLPDATPLREMLVVDAQADILFNFGDAYQRQVLQDTATNTIFSNNVDAHRTYPLQVIQTGTIILSGVRFKPGGLAAFAPMPAFELTNQVLDIRLLFGQPGCELEDQLFEVRFDVSAQVARLNTFFLRRLSPGKHMSTVNNIAHLLEQSGGTMRIEYLSREIGYSIRTIDRLFRNIYGVTPGFYARVIRFQKAIYYLKMSSLRLTEIAVRCGYYDQAHFSRDFVALAGIPPERYRQYYVRAE